ncbi:type I-E CRISPR-associated protein Cas6/Cse3/CasE [Streptomyces sp. FZ201]|uniref:type I-E CRISPR-associated protein Cas6/Cse3/CasE n=1 Tax=Streptomyces sp. FZ201 TaxID=3057122 RepID=UPI0021C0A940|nr:type I-E CRISPR-associated protein Cas6/Cse3/CasE [Streptomyces sp. FZ201]
MTLYLSRLTPHPASRQAQQELGAGTHHGSLHRRVMSLFPDGVAEQARAHFGILFRVEDTPRGSHLLMQSNQPPDPRRLPAQYGTLTTRPLADLLDALEPGLTLHFRCTASPVRKPGHTTRAHYNLPAVVPLNGAAADDWWQRQADNAGLKVLTLHSRPVDAARDWQYPTGTAPADRARNSNRIHHHRVRFDGTAAVIDPDLLRTAIRNGIGRGKAYGCGLLSIAPAPAPA